MQTIFAYGLATGRFAMGSSEPLGAFNPDYVQTQESETLVLDEEGENEAAAGSAPPPPPCPRASASAFDPAKKRKRSLLGEEDVVAITCMTDAVKAVVAAITSASPPGVNPSLYDTVMSAAGFTPEALMVALSHLFDNRAQGNGFVQMGEEHMALWLRTFLAKNYYNV